MDAYHIIGLMSGTSLDGLDIAFVTFTKKEDAKFNFELVHSETVNIPESILELLKISMELSGIKLMELDVQLGKFYAEAVNLFIHKYKIEKTKISCIASHGQTIFHQPAQGITVQIGNGEYLAALTGIKTITNFRLKDVIFGGQGAPLVPKGDFDLFSSEAEAFLNIGGFCNISYINEQKEVIAFDICPGNLPLNKIANLKNLPYDKNGELAKKGSINFFLLDLLNELAYYQQNAPKSLGSEWLEREFYPLIKFDKDLENNLKTIVEHIGFQIATVLNQKNLNSVFLTGGGAHNKYLVERIQHYFNGTIVIPKREIINFKEALVFAYLGLLRLKEHTNCIATVTGAKKNVIGGIIHLP